MKTSVGNVVTKDERPNKALVLCALGAAWVLTYEVEDYLDGFIRDCGGDGTDGFDPVAASVDFKYPGDGLFVCDVSITDDGPGDWPGTREHLLQFSAFRLATVEEFTWFRAGEYIWGVPGAEVAATSRIERVGAQKSTYCPGCGATPEPAYHTECLPLLPRGPNQTP